MTTNKRESLFNNVTLKIIDALKQGVKPWQKTWTTEGCGGFPQNAITGRKYSGINVFLLWLEAYYHDYRSNRWLTFKQAIDAGGKVKKGEKSTLVVMCKPFKAAKLSDKDEPIIDTEGNEVFEDKLYTTGFHVFNIDQCENLPGSITKIPEQKLIDDVSRNNLIEQFIEATQINIKHKYQSKAYYRPSTDNIMMPLANQFNSINDYYATLFHEMVHATGHKNRLNREGIVNTNNSIDKQCYAFEELVAEMGAAFLCAEFGVEGEMQHESYMASWLQILENDNHAIFKASRLAREAFEFLIVSQNAEDIAA